MGTDKAWLDYEGQPLWQFQLKKLRGLASEVLISAGVGSRPFPDAACPVIVDEVVDAGPLGGLYQALKTAGFDRVLLLAVDMPAMSPAYLQSLLDEATPEVGVIPERDGFYEGLAAVYPRRMLALVEEILAGRDHSFQNLARQGITRGFLKARSMRTGEELLFENWNRPEDRR